MSSKKWIKLYIIMLFSILCFIATFNFVVDPGKIYLKKLLNEYYSKEVVLHLQKSKIGIENNGLNERVFKKNLLEQTKSVKCIILGSSRVLQVSKFKNEYINSKCSTFLNLGVSGASFEDLIIFLSLIEKNRVEVDNIFLSIDPWSLKFNMDSRWMIYERIYLDYLNSIHIRMSNDDNFLLKLLSNLLNLEYTMDSFNFLNNKFSLEQYYQYLNVKTLNSDVDFENGIENPVYLNDGSYLYSKKFIKNKKNESIPLGGVNYKIKGELYNSDNLMILKSLIEKLRIKSKIDIVLIPYHENNFKKNTFEKKYIQKFEKFIKEYFSTQNINTFGSFDPIKLGCKKNDFFDFMHPKHECINNLFKKN